MSPLQILAWLFPFSLSPVNGLTWYGLKNPVYKVELKSAPSKLWEAIFTYILPHSHPLPKLRLLHVMSFLRCNKYNNPKLEPVKE